MQVNQTILRGIVDLGLRLPKRLRTGNVSDDYLLLGSTGRSI